MSCLHAVSPSQPEVRVAGLFVVCRLGGHGKLALLDGLAGCILSIKDAAEKLVRDGIRWIGGEGSAKHRRSVIDAALLQSMIGGRVPCQRTVKRRCLRYGLLSVNGAKQDRGAKEEAQSKDREDLQSRSRGTGLTTLQRKYWEGVGGYAHRLDGFDSTGLISIPSLSSRFVVAVRATVSPSFRPPVISAQL